MVARLGCYARFSFSGVLQMLSNLIYVVQVWAGHDVPVLALTIGTENLTNGMRSAAFVAYLSGLCSVAFTATQYALLTSLATIGVNCCRLQADISPISSAGLRSSTSPAWPVCRVLRCSSGSSGANER